MQQKLRRRKVGGDDVESEDSERLEPDNELCLRALPYGVGVLVK